MLQAVILCDTHIGGYKFLENYVDDTDKYIYKAIQSVADYAKNNGIKHMFILGDIFDNPNPTQAMQRRLLKFLKSLNLKVYMISGNHDYSSDGKHSLVMSEFFAEESSKNIYIYTEPKLIKVEGIPFSMLPWPYSKSLTKGPCINCAHITIKGSKSDTGKTMSKGESIKLRDNQFWMIGDLHTRQKYYPGTLIQKSFGEDTVKGFSHLSVQLKEGKFLVNEDWIVRKTEYELINLRIDNVGDLDKIEAFDKNNLKLYTLKVSQDVVLPPNVRQKYPNVHNIKFNGIEKVVDKSGVAIDISGIADPLKGIRRFMKKEGLSPEEIKLGYKYVTEKLKRMENAQ
jgi:calcineurin-like phosphoesterase family protein